VVREERRHVIEAGALLFDMDGLMVDSEPLWFEVERDFARARGGEWTDALADACVGKGLMNTLRVMGQLFGFPVEPVAMIDEIVDAFIARAGELRLKPGCAEILEAARGKLPLACASSSHKRLVEAVLSRLSITAFFDAVVTGDAVVHPKPAPDVFLLAAERLAVLPARCVVLEDSLAGVTAGVAAGMRVIAVPEHDPAPFTGVAGVVVVRDLFAARAQLAL
jgi:mannitol-1-/sugar-/sorbitol-6-/2-deoxyglucose-6-phosphatase